MNKEQEAYVKGVAHSIEVYAQTMLGCVQALQRNSLADMPVDLIEINFRDVTDSCQHVQHILEELMPNLPEDEDEEDDYDVPADSPYGDPMRFVDRS